MGKNITDTMLAGLCNICDEYNYENLTALTVIFFLQHMIIVVEQLHSESSPEVFEEIAFITL